MNIRKVSEGADMTVYLDGRLDAVTAFELDKDLSASLDGVENLTIDLKDLEYISSAGLRTLLKLQKRMDTQGSMKIRNVKKDVQDVLDMTGFSKFLTITDEKKSQFYVSF